MASGSPMMPCALCDLVPGRPSVHDGLWLIACPICGRKATAPTEDAVRGLWASMNVRDPAPLGPALELLDGIEAAMCGMEAIRRVPGAMTVWQRWMDDLSELRRIVREAEGC